MRSDEKIGDEITRGEITVRSEQTEPPRSKNHSDVLFPAQTAEVSDADSADKSVSSNDTEHSRFSHPACDLDSISRWWGSHSFPPRELTWEVSSEALNQGLCRPDDIGSKSTALVGAGEDCPSDFNHKRPSSSASAFSNRRAFPNGPTIWPERYSYSNGRTGSIFKSRRGERCSAAENESLERPRPRGRFPLFLLLFLVVGGAAYYLLFVDGYRVDAVISLMCPDSEPSLSRGWPIQREMLLLRHPRLLYRTARELAELRPSLAGKDRTRRRADVVAFGAPAGSSGVNLPEDYTDTHRVVRWLSDRIRVQSHPEAGYASVSMTGENPELMKAVVSSYLKHYSNYRSTLINEDRRVESRSRAVAPAPYSQELIRVMNDMRKVSSQIHESNLALQLMRSGSGAFRGFLPDNSVIGLPTLDRFQSRIVELELKKRSLSVRYKPNSRDVRSIDLEIDGIRKAMQDRIREQIVFLGKRKQELAALRRSIEAQAHTAMRQNAASLQPFGPASSKRCFQERVGGCSQAQSEPYVTKKPLIVKLGAFAHGFLTGRVSSGNKVDLLKEAVAGTQSHLEPGFLRRIYRFAEVRMK